MRNMKKVTAFFLVTVMTLSLAACGGTGGDKKKDDYNGGKEVEISYWNSGMGTKFLEEMCKTFNAKQSDWYVYFNATAASNAVTATYPLPDVDTIDLYMSGEVSDLSMKVTLDDVLDSTADGDKKSIKEKFDASHLESEIAADGHYYSLTWGGGALAIVYNKTLFEKAGITETPRTTDELTAACDKLLENGIAPLTHFVDDAGSYWDYIQEVWHAQYDGYDYYRNSFYGCKDEAGKSPSKDVLLKKDGRYQVLKAMEQFITPEYVLPGSNSQDHITMQTKFLNEEIGMMVNGSWLSNEMEGTGSVDKFGVMKTPVISSITDKLTTVKSDTLLRKLISAIDSVNDGEKNISEYQSGDGYVVDGKQISAADWDTVKAARGMVAVNYPQQTLFIPSYSDAVDGAKEFLKFFYSDEGYKIFMDNLHYTLPMELSEGEIDRSDWNGFEVEMDKEFQNAETCISRYMKNRHDIFINGGATPYASYKFLPLFCVANAADRVTADETWDEIVKKIDGYFKGWLSNIK
ncbi:MAG: extracellular solute-binding protein [Tyzzerella sp.]|nr:extracellular solute-binding protein [Tyzzerella sp.]